MAKTRKKTSGNSDAPYNSRRAPGIGSITITMPDETREQLNALATRETAV